MPWHWLYYACAGIGFAIGLASEILGVPAIVPSVKAPAVAVGLSEEGASEDSRVR
jgi:hypothetical protein